ncbi:MAG TPA: cytochrome c oxidase subunit 3 [Kofleriaceae bacterium]|nr:cytochrome c oxidase subunit 3 [Kofleriaceae bacterium]
MSTAHDAHTDDHGHGHHGSPFIQHHYDDAQHQFDSGKLGIWIFLAQEVLFFSALFVAYILYRVHHGEIYAYAHKWLDVKYGAINTAVLIFSSLTAAWAVRCAQLNQRRGLVLCLATTIVCACGFLCIKYIEYSHKYHEQILFGRYFDPCISPGGNEMITKSNDCMGAKSTIKWDFGAGKATEGCFESSTIDLDPREPGVQAECEVSEVKLGKDGKTELSKKPITNICADKIGEGEEWEKNKYPCWKPSYQPAVCPDLTDAAKRAQGAAARPQVGILVLYGEEDHQHRGHDIAIKANCKQPPPAQAPDYFSAPSQDSTDVLGKKLVVDKPHAEHHGHDLLYAGPPPDHTGMFLSIYFAMTGLHGIHVLVGIFIFIWLLIRAIKGQFTPDYFGPIDYAALYWHIVDLIWIFLFPLLYLIV